MKAVFSLRERPTKAPDRKPELVEYVEISGLTSPGEVVHRMATDEDRAQFSAAYAEFQASLDKATTPEAAADPE
jgi:hypothetical protein